MNFLHECALKHYQFAGYFEGVEAENKNLVCVNMNRWLGNGNSLKRYTQLFLFVCFT